MKKKLFFLWAFCVLAVLGITAQNKLNETFDASTFPPAGWTTVHVSGDVFWEQGYWPNPLGAYSAYIGTMASQNNNYLISPMVKPTEGDTLLTFYAESLGDSSPNTYLRVRISTTSPNVSAFTDVVAEYQNELWRQTWQKYTVNLKDYVNMPIYIAFQHEDNAGFGVMIDSVMGPELHTVTCVAPENIVASNITETSATVSWQSAGDKWGVVISSTELDPSALAAATPDTLTATSKAFANLTAGTEYFVYVKTICAGEESYYNQVRFRTPDMVYSLPFTENFDGDTHKFNFNNPYQNRWFVGSAITNEGKSMYITSDETGLSADYSWGQAAYATAYANIRFDNTSAEYEVSFDWINNANQDDLMKVYLVPASMEMPQTWYGWRTAEWLAGNDVYRLADHTYFYGVEAWTHFSTSIPADWVSGRDMKIVFMWYNDYGTGANPAACIDNVSVEAKACPAPMNLSYNGVGPDTLNIAWTGNATSYVFQHRETSESEWITDTVQATSNIAHIVLRGLMANYTYQIRLAAVCSNGTLSVWTPVYQVTTACGPETVGGYWAEDFQEINGMPYCWRRPVTDRATGGTTDFPSTTTSAGQRTLKFLGRVDMATTPEFLEPVQDLTMTLSLNRYSNQWSGRFEVGVMSNPDDTATYTRVADLTDSIQVQNTWKRITISMASAPQGKQYIAFKHTADTTSSNAYYRLDSIVITSPMSCERPQTVNLEVVNGNQIELAWASVAGESNWTLAYKKQFESTWTLVENITQPGYILTGLKDNTIYQLKLKSVCVPGEDESIYTDVFTVQTACGVQILPFVEDFTGVGVNKFPPTSCWSNYEIDIDSLFMGYSPREANTAAYRGWHYSGDAGLMENAKKATAGVMSEGTGNRNNLLVTPSFEVNGSLMLDFDVAFHQGSSANAPYLPGDAYFAVVVSEDNGMHWSRSNMIKWLPMSDSIAGEGEYLMRDIAGQVAHISLPLDQYVGKTIKIGFYAGSVATTGYNEFDLDNIQVSEVIIAPPTVDTEDATDITETSATLNATITDGDRPTTDYGFYWKKTTDTRYNIATPQGGSYSAEITGLEPGTEYEFFAYATTEMGTTFGDTLRFTTAGEAIVYEHPIVTTLPATDMTTTTATLHSSIQEFASEPVTARGFKYRTGEGEWLNASDSLLTGLQPNTEYQYYAYAITAQNATGYQGETLTFTTTSHIAPTVVTKPATAITASSAKLNAEITQGSESIDLQGWKYRKDGNQAWSDAPADGVIQNLQPATKYYFYAYAKTANYEINGDTLDFTTAENATSVELAENSVMVYPNPAKDEVVISVDGLVGDAVATIIDMQGKVVGSYAVSASEGKTKVDVSNFSDGSYIVRVSSKNFNKVNRLIIKK